MHVGEASFVDTHDDFTIIDGDAELEMQEDKVTDDEDWECGNDYGRICSVYDFESSEGEYDSDHGKTPAQLQTKYKGELPSVYTRTTMTKTIIGDRMTTVVLGVCRNQIVLDIVNIDEAQTTVEAQYSVPPSMTHLHRATSILHYSHPLIATCLVSTSQQINKLTK